MECFLLRHGTVLTMDAAFTLYEDGYVLFRGAQILAVGSCAALDENTLPADCQVLDCTGKLILPGMVNTHCHAPMVVFRSLGDDVPDRLRRYMIPLENSIMDETVCAASSLYAMGEMLLGGTTTVCDNYAYTQVSARSAEKIGMRAVLGGPERVMGSTEPDPAAEKRNLAYQKQFIADWKGHPLVHPMVACHAPYSESEAQLTACTRLAEEEGVLMTMHTAEMPYEAEACMQKYGVSSVKHLDELGVLRPGFLAAHAVLVDEDDMQLMARRGVSVSHNIGSNLKSAKGVAPVARMRQLGIPVGLGTDGAMSGNTLDVMTQLPLCAKLQKTSTHDRSAFPAKEVLSMATLEGARALGLADRIGSLEPGKLADIILLETDSANMCPIYDPYSVIVYSANPSNVETVFVNGVKVVDRRRLLTVDFKAVRREMMQHCDRIRAAADAIDRGMEQVSGKLAY